MKYIKPEIGFYKNALALMLPMIIQNIVTNTMQLADTFMVGALGEIELAAVTMANSIFFVLLLLIFGIQSGASVLVAQYNGRGSVDAINRVMGIGLYASLGLTTIVSLLTFFFPREIMGIITNNADLIEPGADYARIVGFSYVFMAISGIYISVQRSMENPRFGAYLLTLSGIMNIVLNYMLIFGKWGAPAMGCAGAALATVISRVFEVLVVLIYAPLSKRLPLELPLVFRPGRLIAGDFVRYSLPVICNEGLWSLAMTVYAVIMGHMPDSTPILAAYTISGNIDRLVAVALFAAGNASAVITGREIGRGNRDTLYSIGVALNRLCFSTGIASLVGLLLVRQFAADSFIFPLMNISAEAGGIAKYMLLLLALVMPLRAVNLCNIVGVFRGGGDVHYALMCDVSPIYFICLPTAALCGLVFGLGIKAVYLCMCADELIRICLILPRLKSGKWINNVTRDTLV